LNKNIFFHFFFTPEFSHFLGQKMKKNIFRQKQFWKIFFLKKTMFLKFLFQKVTNFCSKNKNEKKNKKKYFRKKFEKKKIFWNFCPKKVFLGCLIIRLPPSHENKQFFIQEGGQLSGNFGSEKIANSLGWYI
jgi:hypothetical protein